MRTSTLVLACLGAWLVACESGASLGARCARNGECAAPLVCRIGRCRSECVEARDCPQGQVCLIDAEGLGACELPMLDECALSCDAPLICASGHCRVTCATASECPGGHVCASGACQRADVDGGVVDDAGPDAAPSVDASRDANAPDTGPLCDPVLGTGCADRCGLLGGLPACTATGSGTLESPCTAESDCAVGFSCQGDRCIRVCRPSDPTLCGAHLACSRSSVVGASFLPSENDVGLCTESCMPVGDTGAGDHGCPVGTTCSIGTASIVGDFTWCREIRTLPSPASPEGGPCTYEYNCQAGLGCYSHNVCRRFCTYPDGPECAGADVCTLLLATLPGGVLVGECTPP